MITCKECILLKQEGVCRHCRNATKKMYLDFLTEIRKISQDSGTPEQQLSNIRKAVYVEGQMINSITPHNFKELFDE